MQLLAAIIIIFWAGFVSSISFMEAWLKFRAEGVTRTIGLSIGKKVFTAMNRMEWIFLLLFLSLIILQHFPKSSGYLLSSGFVILILILQTFFLLPALNKRAAQIINGNQTNKSSVHLLYGMAEIIKVILLLITGYLLYS